MCIHIYSVEFLDTYSRVLLPPFFPLTIYIRYIQTVKVPFSCRRKLYIMFIRIYMYIYKYTYRHTSFFHSFIHSLYPHSFMHCECAPFSPWWSPKLKGWGMRILREKRHQTVNSILYTYLREIGWLRSIKKYMWSSSLYVSQKNLKVFKMHTTCDEKKSVHQHRWRNQFHFLCFLHREQLSGILWDCSTIWSYSWFNYCVLSLSLLSWIYSGIKYNID